MSVIPNQDTSYGITNLYLNPTQGEEWDIVFDGSGRLLTITDKEYVTQKVTQILRTSKGEVTTDLEYGIPYMEEIIGIKNPNLSVISQIFIDALMEDQVLQSLGISDVEIGFIEVTVDRILVVRDMVVRFESEFDVEIERLSI